MNEQLRVQNRLRIVQWAAWIDLILLVALLTSSFSGQRDFVHVLGPLHGINFLLLVVIVGTAALDGMWGWWFPLVVFFTGGAPGALIGEWILKRRIKSSSSDYNKQSGEEIRHLTSPGNALPEERENPLDEYNERGARKDSV
jgi:hypothetical protein